MNVERTIEYILQMQAKAEVRMAEHDARMAKLDARMDKFDRSLDGIRKLIQTGMKMLVKIEKTQQSLAEEVRELAAAQRKTERNLDRLIESIGKQRSNGHRPKN